MASKQIVSTGKYAKGLFEDSLITGVPQIILTQTISRKIMKSVVLACCLIGFVYQTTEFLKIFWNYPTVLDIDVEYPEVIEPPAITFCNINGIKRIKFCKRYPQSCETPMNIPEFCKRFPDTCAVNNHSSLKYPIKDAWKFEENVRDEYLESFGHFSNETLKFCRKLRDRNEYEQCSTNNTIHMMMSTGTTGYRNCYTIYSNIESAELNPHSVPVPKMKEALFHLIFQMEPEEYFRPDREIGAVVAIHSPNSLVNPFYEGFVVKPSRLYTVHLKMVEEKLLPSPYETECKDYKSMWKQRGGKGPLNQEMCVAECIYNASLEHCNCVAPDIMYHHSNRICREEELDECFFFNVSECYSFCQQPCEYSFCQQPYEYSFCQQPYEFTDFEYDVQERILEDPNYSSIEGYRNDEPVSKKLAVMLIFLKRPEVIIYSHRPQYEDIEVFSFLGGYVGMWLGISLIAVFDFLESVSLTFCFWIRNKFDIFTFC